MKKLFRKSAAIISAAAILASQIIGICAFADDAVTVTVSATATADGAFIANEQSLAVSSDKAESYGFEDEVTGSVSALDALVALHEAAFGDSFTSQTAADYIAISSGWINKAFKKPASASGFLLNYAYTDKMITQAQMEDGDSLEFFFYQNAAYYADFYKHIDDFEIEVGEEITINTEGVEFMYMYAPEPPEYAYHYGEGISLAYVNEDGTLTEIEGAQSDEDGDITISFENAGVYQVSLVGEVDAECFSYVSCDFEETSAPVIPSVTIVTVTDKKQSVKLDGSGTEEDPYLIGSYNDLLIVKEEVESGYSFEGEYLLLTSNIELSSDWTPMGGLVGQEEYIALDVFNQYTYTGKGVNIIPFGGTLDGGNKTVTVAKGGYPLLRFVRNAEVKNLNIYGEEIAGCGLVSDYVVDYGSDGDYATGCPRAVTIDNVTLKEGSSTLGSGFIGGFASGDNAVTIKNSTIEKNVVIGYTKDKSNIGSFCGEFNGTVKNCVSYADVYGADYVGGLVASKGQSMGECKISQSGFYGNVTAIGSFAGGILGSGYPYEGAPLAVAAEIKNCLAVCHVNAHDCVGGIFGGEPVCENYADDGHGSVGANVFYGEINSQGKCSGGIVGFMKSFCDNPEMNNNYYLDKCGTDKGIGHVELSDSVDLTKCAAAVTAEQMSNGAVLEKLDNAIWEQGKKYPILNEDPAKDETAGKPSDESGSINKKTITVSVTVKGDIIHDSDTDGKVHGNTKGGLQTWISAQSVSVDSGSTAWDAIKPLLDKAGITYKNTSGNYLEYMIKNGVKLGEMTNGKNAGWLYTLNNKLPDNGMADQKLANGDKIILFYSDDWSLENGNEKWASSSSSSSVGGGGKSPSATAAPSEAAVLSATDKPENNDTPEQTAKPDLENASDFADVPKTHWAYSGIKALTDKGILNGRSASEFAPDENITRAEFAAILSRMSGETLSEAGDKFTDVPKGAWYAGNISWAIKAGVVNGISKTEFAPDDNVTRQDMAVMIKRYADYMAYEFNADSEPIAFADENAIADYAKDAVNVMQSAGIIKGIDKNIFAPAAYATRAQAAQMLYAVLTRAEE